MHKVDIQTPFPTPPSSSSTVVIVIATSTLHSSSTSSSTSSRSSAASSSSIEPTTSTSTTTSSSTSQQPPQDSTSSNPLLSNPTSFLHPSLFFAPLLSYVFLFPLLILYHSHYYSSYNWRSNSSVKRQFALLDGVTYLLGLASTANSQVHHLSHPISDSFY